MGYMGYYGIYEALWDMRSILGWVDRVVWDGWVGYYGIGGDIMGYMGILWGIYGVAIATGVVAVAMRCPH